MNLAHNVSVAHKAQVDALYRCKLVPDLSKIPERFRHGGRGASAFATLEDLCEKLGEPHDHCPKDHWYKYDCDDFMDGKVSAEWYISTPRGLATVYDYWWNPKGIVSIGSASGHDNRCVLWAVRWLRTQGIEATFCIDNKELKEQLASRKRKPR